MGTSNAPDGITTAAKSENLGSFILPDSTKAHTYMEDFDYFNGTTTEEWIISTVELGGGSASEALANADGGILLLTNDTNDNDSIAFSKVGESFLFEAGKQTWFKSRFSLSSDLAIWVMGLQKTITTPGSATDGVYLSSGDNVTNKSLTSISTASGGSSSVLLTTEDFTGEFFTVGFHYDGVDKITGYINDVALGAINVDNLTEVQTLTPQFLIQNESAASRIMSLDYIMAAKER